MLHTQLLPPPNARFVLGITGFAPDMGLSSTPKGGGKNWPWMMLSKEVCVSDETVWDLSTEVQLKREDVFISS